MRRETILLARDPAVVRGHGEGDWAILARGASPRVLAVTRDGLADFITIRDARGTPLVQVPASPPPSLRTLHGRARPVLTLRLAGGQPYFLVTAPVQARPDGSRPAARARWWRAGASRGSTLPLDRLPGPSGGRVRRGGPGARGQPERPAHERLVLAATVGTTDAGDEPSRSAGSRIPW